MLHCQTSVSFALNQPGACAWPQSSQRFEQCRTGDNLDKEEKSTQVKHPFMTRVPKWRTCSLLTDIWESHRPWQVDVVIWNISVWPLHTETECESRASSILPVYTMWWREYWLVRTLVASSCIILCIWGQQKLLYSGLVYMAHHHKIVKQSILMTTLSSAVDKAWRFKDVLKVVQHTNLLDTNRTVCRDEWGMWWLFLQYLRTWFTNFALFTMLTIPTENVMNHPLTLQKKCIPWVEYLRLVCSNCGKVNIRKPFDFKLTNDAQPYNVKSFRRIDITIKCELFQRYMTTILVGLSHIGMTYWCMGPVWRNTANLLMRHFIKLCHHRARYQGMSKCLGTSIVLSGTCNLSVTFLTGWMISVRYDKIHLPFSDN